MSEWPRNEFGPNLSFEDADRVVAALGIAPGDQVLEVGGASNTFERADVVCDLTFGATGQRNGSPGTFTKGVRYVEAPVESLPFADREFDFVVCRQVLEHVADPARAAAELSRVAARGLVEVPSRAGELMNGNPTHRWIVDLEDGVLVFHPRCFVEHPFDNLFYGRLFQDPSLRERAETRFRNLSNHQVLFEGRLRVRVEAARGPRFDYDDPVQAGRSHYSFARNCLLQGADPTYALPDAMLAARLLAGHPAPRLLLAAYQARLMQLEDAGQTLAGLSDNASASLRRLIAMAKRGDPVDLRTIPVPDPLDAKVAAAGHDDRPKASIVVPAPTAEGLRAAVESALSQDYPDVEVVVATSAAADDVGAALSHLSGVARLRVVSEPAARTVAALMNAGMRASMGNVLGFVVPPDRLQCHHLDRIVAGLLASGADAAHGDRLLLDGGGVLAPDLAPGSPAAAAFSASTLVMRSAAALALGPLDAASDVAVPTWLDALAKRHRVFHVPSVTVESAGPRPSGAPVVEGALAQLRLRPLDLYREIVALHARESALARRVRELEERLGARS
jgi:SAM-dependent methyltransferase